MNENKKDCTCPFCQESFDPGSDTATEFLARGILSVYAEMQLKASKKGCASDLPCPRCGCYNMSDKVTHNALSRYMDIYICDVDGNEESILQLIDNTLPLSDWWIVKELLALKNCSSDSGMEP